MLYSYTLIPVGPVTHISGEMVVERTISSSERYATGDIVPAGPGTWTVEQVGSVGMTQWASESVDRLGPRTVTSPVRLYCRVEL